MSVYSKCSHVYFCQILFKLVYTWESYQENKKGERFIETKCNMSSAEADRRSVYYLNQADVCVGTLLHLWSPRKCLETENGASR